MFKLISNWLEAKQNEAKTQQYDEGFGYGATQILKYDNDTLIAVDCIPPSESSFQLGQIDAFNAITDLQDKAKKLERYEAENADLREIIRKMQTELRHLLEQVPTQALSVPAEEPKLTFRIEDLPDWTQWVAQDKDGRWFAYEKKPWAGDLDWIEDSRDGDVDNIFDGEPNPNWKETLQRLTR